MTQRRDCRAPARPPPGAWRCPKPPADSTEPASRSLARRPDYLLQVDAPFRGLVERSLLSPFWVWSRAENAPGGLLDPSIVDACFAPSHEAGPVEFPEFVAVASPPLALAVAAFVLEAHSDAIPVEAPEVLPQRIVEFPLPLLRQESDDFVPSCDKDVAVAPDRVDRVRKRDPSWIARVPSVLRGLHLLRRGLACER